MRSHGGLTTNIVALADALGQLANFVVLPGQAHDMKDVEPLIDGVALDALFEVVLLFRTVLRLC